MKEIQTNAMEVERLLSLYVDHNFLYPAKREKLLPVLPQIEENLKKAFTLPESLYRTLTCYKEEEGEFTSIAAWKYSSTSMIILHLVSNNPVKTREIFLYHILKLASLQSDGPVNAILTYYQPKTRFVHNMFTYLYERRVNDGVLIEPYNFYQYRFGLQQEGRAVADGLSIEPLQTQDYPQFHRLLFQERGLLYLNALDLKPGYFTLDDLNYSYQQAGLFRSRVVLVAKDASNGEILGSLLINQGSVGLHFSLIENSSELIVDNRLVADKAHFVTDQLLRAAAHYYQHCPLGFMPLLVHCSQADLMENQAATLQRQYNMMVCDRPNFINWVTYLLHEYEKSLHYPSTAKRLIAESAGDNPPAVSREAAA